MKNLFLLSIFSLVLFSCERNEEEFNFESQFIVDNDETLDVSVLDFFPENPEIKISNDYNRKTLLNKETNVVSVPFNFHIQNQEGLKMRTEFDPDAKLQICVKIARRNPSSNPDKCQGNCLCGFGFNCVIIDCRELGYPEPYYYSNISLSREIEQPAIVAVNDNSSTIDVHFTNNIDWEYFQNQ